MASKDKLSSEYRTIIDGLVARRKKRRITQVRLAELMATDQSQVSKLERGERRLDILDFVRYAAAIGEDPAELLRALIAPLDVPRAGGR